MTAKAARLIDAKALAVRLGLHIKTVRKATRAGDYDAFAIRLGTPQRPVWRYDEARLGQWLDTHRPAA